MSGTNSGAHLALVYSTDKGNAPVPARIALDLLEDVIAKAGGDEALRIAARSGTRSIFLGANLWKDVGIACEILSRVDPAYTPRVAIAYEKFVEEAPPDDPDLPKARAPTSKPIDPPEADRDEADRARVPRAELFEHHHDLHPRPELRSRAGCGAHWTCDRQVPTCGRDPAYEAAPRGEGISFGRQQGEIARVSETVQVEKRSTRSWRIDTSGSSGDSSTDASQDH
jgi:hypothetical protein